jgi:hypothetical protein
MGVIVACRRGKTKGIRPFFWRLLPELLPFRKAHARNNICERILRKAILHRKNALFYDEGDFAGSGGS